MPATRSAHGSRYYGSRVRIPVAGPDTILMSEDFYRSMLEAQGIIHWLTLDHIAKPWRQFRARAIRK